MKIFLQRLQCGSTASTEFSAVEETVNCEAASRPDALYSTAEANLRGTCTVLETLNNLMKK